MLTIVYPNSKNRYSSCRIRSTKQILEIHLRILSNGSPIAKIESLPYPSPSSDTVNCVRPIQSRPIWRPSQLGLGSLNDPHPCYGHINSQAPSSWATATSERLTTSPNINRALSKLMTMGIALLKRQGTNYPADVNTEGDSWGYSNVYRDAMMAYCLADINIDRHCHKVGLRCGDLVAVPTMVRRRILPRSTEDQKRGTPIEIPSSTSATCTMTEIY